MTRRCRFSPQIADSPAPLLWRAGVTCVPCADNRLLSATSAAEEYARLLEETPLGRPALEGMARAGIERAAFDYRAQVAGAV